MKKISDRIGKTATAIGVFLGILTAIIACWQFYKSANKKNIAGAWKLHFKVVSSSYKAYIGETHTQKVFFNQNEFQISGNGEKWEYNGKLLPFNAHRKVEYIGNLEDNCLKCTYVLYGLLRESSGGIDVTLSDDGKSLSGIFYGTAADTKGTVTGEREM